MYFRLRTELEKARAKRTYKEMVQMTGIEQTRLFRIVNGVVPRLDEVEKLINSGLVPNIFASVEVAS